MPNWDDSVSLAESACLTYGIGCTPSRGYFDFSFPRRVPVNVSGIWVRPNPGRQIEYRLYFFAVIDLLRARFD